MARVSFTLRRNVIDRGSFVRYDVDTFNAAASVGNAASAGTWEYDTEGSRDVDTSLRSDGYTLPAAEFAETFFEAVAVAYGVNELTWAVNLYPLSDLVLPSEVVIVHSYEAFPETIDSGNVLVESSADFKYDHTNVGQGRWSYYSLFVRYRSLANPTGYYDRVATIELLNPVMYGSTALLWDRVPQYYKELDYEIGQPVDNFSLTDLGVFPSASTIGPLYRFLSVFGFEMDRIRTTVDYLAVSKDPFESNTENLEAISSMMGLGLSPTLYSGKVVRSVLDDIGYLRSSKGTLDSVRTYGRAVSGCDIDVDPDTKEITFYAERTNYITDPLDATGLISAPRAAHAVEAVPPVYNMGSYDPTSYNPADYNTYPPTFSSTANYVPGMYWTSASAGTFNGVTVAVDDYIVAYLDGEWPVDSNGDRRSLTVEDMSFSVSGYTFASTKYSSYTIHTQSGTRYTANNSGDSDGVTHLMFRITCPVPAKLGDNVFFSVHSGTGADHVVWARMVDTSGNVMGESNRVIRSGTNYIEIPIKSNAQQTTYTVGFIEFMVDLSAAGTFDARYFLVERNNIGKYFDGNNFRGGWLVDTVTTPGTSILVSDYDWSDDGDPDPGDSSTYQNGDPYLSISVYTENFKVKQDLLSSRFLDEFPVNVADHYSIVDYNAVPGMDAIDQYFFSLP